MPYRVAVPKDLLRKHLSFWHKGTKGHKKIAAEFDPFEAAVSIADLRLREDGSAPLSLLLPPVAGFFCPDCPKFKTISEDEYRRHVRKERLTSERIPCKRQDSCYLQRWTIGRGPAFSGYWKVDVTTASETPDSGGYEVVAEKHESTWRNALWPRWKQTKKHVCKRKTSRV